MSRSDDSGCGCLFIIIGIAVLILILSQMPAFFSWYGDKLSGDYGGAWMIPLFLLLIAIICYFKDKNK